MVAESFIHLKLYVDSEGCQNMTFTFLHANKLSKDFDQLVDSYIHLDQRIILLIVKTAHMVDIQPGLALN